MKIRKLSSFRITCPNCGSEMLVSSEEYRKYRSETEDYSGFHITCQRENKDGKGCDIEYTNMDCPVCGHYIPVTVDEIDTDKFGFCYSNCVEPVYDFAIDMDMESYIKKALGTEDVDSEN